MCAAISLIFSHDIFFSFKWFKRSVQFRKSGCLISPCEEGEGANFASFRFLATGDVVFAEDYLNVAVLGADVGARAGLTRRISVCLISTYSYATVVSFVRCFDSQVGLQPKVV